MRRKAQLTILIILGVLILIVVGLVVYLAARPVKEDVEKETQQTINLANVKQQAESYMQDCLNELTLQANIEYGVLNNEDTRFRYETYIYNHLSDCDLNNIKEMIGAEIVTDYSSSSTTVAFDNSNNIIVSVELPITIAKQDSQIELREFSTKFNVNYYFELPMSAGRLTRDHTISLDDSTSLTFYSGTEITPHVDRISFFILDRSYGFSPSNEVVVGNRVYVISPQHLVFSQPVKITMRYSQENKPNSLNYNQIRASKSPGLEWTQLDSLTSTSGAVAGMFSNTNNPYFAATFNIGDVPVNEQYTAFDNAYYDFGTGLFVSGDIYDYLTTSYSINELRPITREITTEKPGFDPITYQLFSFRSRSTEKLVIIKDLSHRCSTDDVFGVLLSENNRYNFTNDNGCTLAVDPARQRIEFSFTTDEYYKISLANDYCYEINIENSGWEELVPVTAEDRSRLTIMIPQTNTTEDSEGNLDITYYPQPGDYVLWGPSDKIYSGVTVSMNCYNSFNQFNIPRFSVQ
ncbi:hypothetical protein JW930_06050 [Candidatus Woesearchaeota archaeon]|nr:hypothetical protein [Candidatus Woesearchaeota archaeon]